MNRFSRHFLVGLFVALGLAASSRADLVAHWTFDGNLLDSTINGNNGTAFGPTFSADVPAVIGSGQSVAFAGGTHRIEVADINNSLDLPGGLTLSAWVKPIATVPAGFDGLLAKSPSTGSAANHAGNFEWRINTGRTMSFLYQRGGANDTVGSTTTTVVPSGAWSHVAVTAQPGGNVNFYLNGAPAGTFPVFAGLAAFPVNNSNFYIGNRADFSTATTPMNGNLDEIRVYNEVLSAAQIAVLAFGPLAAESYPMIPGVTARATSQYINGTDQRLAANAVNGNGMIGKLHVAGPPSGNMWLSDGVEAARDYEMDLGGVYTVDDLRFWNYNENAAPVACCLDRGVRTFDVYTAGLDGVYGATPVLTGATLARAPGTTSDFSQLISLGGVEARFIKLDITSNHGDPSFTGLSEVKANGTGIDGFAPIHATVEDVSSELVVLGFDRRAEHSANFRGMAFNDRHSTVPDGNMWLSAGSALGAAPDTSPQITYDMGSVVDLAKMEFWNYNELLEGHARQDELLGRGIALAHIQVAGEDKQFRTLIEYQEFDRADINSDTDDFAQTINLMSTEARYVRLVIIANHNGKDFTNPASDDGVDNYAGISEVKFFAVPEPSAIVLALVGAIGAIASRRRTSIVC